MPVFQGAGAYIFLDNGTDNPDKRIWAAAGGFAFIVPNKRIGMPATEDMPFSFHEYAIPADRVVTLLMHWDNGVADCSRKVFKFIPLAGHDYNAAMRVKGGYCCIRVRELVNVDEKGMATPVAFSYQWVVPVD